MDGVLANFDASAIKAVPEEHRLSSHEKFYLADNYPQYNKEIRRLTAQPDFFENLELIDGALEGWQRIIDAGFDPQICSAPLTSNPSAVEGKIKFLDKYFVPEFGEQVVETAIIDKKKYNYPGLALIDDRPQIETNSGKAEWEHILFDRGLSELSTAAFRLMSWHDQNLEAILNEIYNLKKYQ